jgi:hypothetical protein
MPRRKRNPPRPRVDADWRQGLGAHLRADGAPKNAYRTRSDALAVALERQQDTGVELNVYRCDFCSAWHMGNPTGREP